MLTKPNADLAEFTQTAMQYSLYDALLNRRSRRFFKGATLNEGLDFSSDKAPQPLTIEEEALLAFAGSGLTGYALGELPYEKTGGNIMIHFVGRTVPSGDSVHAVSLIIINDDGAWYMKRPQDFEADEIDEVVALWREGKVVEAYERSRVQILDTRPTIPNQYPMQLPINFWSANTPGSTYFLGVNDVSTLLLNVLLAMFFDDMHCYLLDDMNGMVPAGVAAFGKSQGGFLSDDMSEGNFQLLSYAIGATSEFIAWEQGAMFQNIALMTQALGLGGFPHYGGHPIWLHALGFRHVEADFLPGMKLPFAVGLEKDGKPLIKTFQPPYYESMEAAVQDFVEYKFGQGGTMRNNGKVGAWKNGADIQNKMPRYPDHTVGATIAAAEYIYNIGGGIFPKGGPFHLNMGFQAHHLDLDFYEQYYKDDSISDAQRQRQG